nr:MAG TPA: hypothetical protein [Caudoviricetes sp.]
MKLYVRRVVDYIRMIGLIVIGNRSTAIELYGLDGVISE